MNMLSSNDNSNGNENGTSKFELGLLLLALDYPYLINVRDRFSNIVAGNALKLRNWKSDLPSSVHLLREWHTWCCFCGVLFALDFARNSWYWNEGENTNRKQVNYKPRFSFLKARYTLIEFTLFVKKCQIAVILKIIQVTCSPLDAATPLFLLSSYNIL